MLLNLNKEQIIDGKESKLMKTFQPKAPSSVASSTMIKSKKKKKQQQKQARKANYGNYVEQYNRFA